VGCGKMSKPNQQLDIIFSDINKDCQILVVDIKDFDQELKDLVDKYFFPICETDDDMELKYIKKRLSDFLKSKKDSTTETGAIAEFFIHLILNHCGFTQEFIFFNLEERSIKKGFDGYYSFNEDQWIMESKSGDITSKKISHNSKINEAYKDLSDKLSGKVENNPWQNAYSHAKFVDSSDSVVNKIKKLKNDYLKNTFYSIDKFNIIPCSSIFTIEISQHSSKSDIMNEIKESILKYDYKKIKAICVTNNTKNKFIKYIDNWEV
jgi:hypothetical protein